MAVATAGLGKKLNAAFQEQLAAVTAELEEAKAAWSTPRGYVPVSELDPTIVFLKMLPGAIPINTEEGVRALCKPQIKRLEALKGKQ